MTAHSLDHVALAVQSIAAVRPLFERLGGTAGTPTMEMPALGVNVAFIGPVEILEPRSPQSPVAHFLEQRGPGIHHLAYRVPDLAAELQRLEAEGFQRLEGVPDREGRVFLHPGGTGGIIVELVQAPAA